MSSTLLAGFVGVLGVSLLSLRRPSDRHVGAFARVYSVELTQRNAQVLRSAIARMRRWRLGGALVGAAAFAMSDVLFDASLTLGRALVAVAVGLSIAIVAAELTRTPAAQPGRTAARVERRHSGDYLAPWIRWLLVGLAVGVAGFVVHAGLFRSTIDPGPVPSTRAYVPPGQLAAITAGLLALSLGTTGILRRLARAPEPVTSSDLLSAARAIRTSAMVNIVGAYLLGVSAIASQLVWPLAVVSSGALSWIASIAALAATVGMAAGVLVCFNALPRTGGYLRVPSVPTRESAA